MFPQLNIIYPFEVQPQYHENYHHHQARQSNSNTHGGYARAHPHPHPPPLHLHHGSVGPPTNQPPTPLDLSYLHSMIPSNLLVNSPYFQMPHSAVFQDHPGSAVSDSESDTGSSGSNSMINTSHANHQHLHYNRPPVGYGYGFGLQPPMSPMTSNPRISTPTNPNFYYHQNSSPYPTHINNSSSYGSSSVSNHNLDQLNLSRTIIIKNLSEDLTLNELLTQVDLGPIEYCKMFSRATPQRILDQDPSITPNLKVCYISFVNSKISVLFHLKYLKNSQNLSNFKAALKDSKYLKIQLNDTSSATNGNQLGDYNSCSKNQDFIKLKTLNYILDFGATRCLLIKFSIKDVTVLPEGVETNSAVKTFIHTQCQKFGEVEDFKISLSKSKSDPEQPEIVPRIEGKVLVHFTSIDAAIKTYESYLRRIQNDKQRTIDGQDSSRRRFKARKDENNVNILFDIKFSSTSFHKDRCDRTVAKEYLQKPRKRSNIANIPEEENASIEYFADGEITANGIHDNADDIDDVMDNSIVDIPGEPDLLAKESSSELEAPSPPLSLSSTSPIPDRSRIHRHHPQQPNPQFYSTVRRNSHPTFVPGSPMLVQNGYGTQPGQSFELQQNPYLLPMNNMQNNSYNPDSFNIDNRTIYLGNLHPNTTIEEIANNVRAGGLVESINYHPEKKVCFITFVDAQVALKFYVNHQVLHQLIVHGHDITVGWAKNHSGPVNREIALAVTAGASRNVYIGIKLVKDANGVTSNAKSDLSLPDEGTLRADFSKFGELEQINFYHNKDCGFLNFLNIVDAITLVETFELNEVDAKIRLRKIFSPSTLDDVENDPEIIAITDDFYAKYGEFKISFAKDRCGNPPKFSFKKKASNYSGSTYQQYQHLLHGSLNRRKGKHFNNNGRREYYDEETRMQEHDSFMEDTINQEAAMVFGIISNSEPKIEVSDKEEKDVEPGTEVRDPKLSIKSEANEEVALSDLSTKDHELQVVDDEPEDDEDEDDDDDDDVSIIIGSDETSSTTAQNSSSKDFSKKSLPKSQGRNGHDRIYHSKFNASDPMVFKRSSRNSSNISLNSNYVKYSQPAPPNQQAYKLSSSPCIQHQQLYYVASPGVAPPSGSRGYSGYSLQGYAVPNTPNPGYFPPQAQQYYMVHPQTRQQHLHTNQGPQKNQYSTSGSQVMAQYLARSQQDNFLYAASILNSDVGIEEDLEYDYLKSYRRASDGQHYTKARPRKPRK